MACAPAPARVDVASKGGNFILNIRQTPEGPAFEEWPRGIGEWLETYGDSICGTTYGPLQDLAFGRTTARGKAVYPHVFKWPKEEKLEVPGLAAHVVHANLVAGKGFVSSSLGIGSASKCPLRPLTLRTQCWRSRRVSLQKGRLGYP